MDRVIPAWQV